MAKKSNVIKQQLMLEASAPTVKEKTRNQLVAWLKTDTGTAIQAGILAVTLFLGIISSWISFANHADDLARQAREDAAKAYKERERVYESLSLARDIGELELAQEVQIGINTKFFGAKADEVLRSVDIAPKEYIPIARASIAACAANYHLNTVRLLEVAYPQSNSFEVKRMPQSSIVDELDRAIEDDIAINAGERASHAYGVGRLLYKIVNLVAPAALSEKYAGQREPITFPGVPIAVVKVNELLGKLGVKTRVRILDENPTDHWEMYTYHLKVVLQILDDLQPSHHGPAGQ